MKDSGEAAHDYFNLNYQLQLEKSRRHHDMAF
jgi:hypothetical protein